MFGKDFIDQGLVKDIKQLEWFLFIGFVFACTSDDALD